jgi:hypothetical protein
MMVTYVALPSRIIGIKSDRSRRDKLTATAIGGAIGAVVCSPAYALGRVGIILLGTGAFPLGVILLIIAVPLQTGAVTATKAVKFSAKLFTGQEVTVGEDADPGRSPGSAGPPASEGGIGTIPPAPSSAPSAPIPASVEEA